jgi:hypothetical protein
LRQTSFKWHVIVITALLIVILGIIPASDGNGSTFSRFGLPETKLTTSDKVKGLFDCAAPVADNPGDFTFRANLVPPPNNGLANPRQNPPVWERILLVKQIMVMLGFFFAIMLIALFFIFYQNARNGSESDDLSSVLVIEWNNKIFI